MQFGSRHPAEAAWRCYVQDMGNLAGAGRRAGHKMLRRATKGIPFVGTAVVLGFLAHTVRRKGMVNGVLDTALDAVPFLGTLKLGAELLTGEWFPDRSELPSASPSPRR
jgi:hypothetical protein